MTCRLAAILEVAASILCNGEAAIATYAWSLTYDREGQRCQDEGHEILVLARGEGGWLVRWRAVLTR